MSKDIIKSSEIAQYEYCPVGWFLQKKGYEPKSPSIDVGKNIHIDLGEKITALQTKEKTSRYLLYIGLVLIIIAILLSIVG